MKKLFGISLTALPLGFFSLRALADIQFNLPVGVTPISHQIYSLHMLAFYVCVAIGIVVFGLMLIAVIKFRKSKGAVAANFSHNTRLEIIWTIIPVLILAGLAVPSIKTLINMEDNRNPDLTVKITGYQWRWGYDYLGKNVSFISSLDAASNAARQPGSDISPFSVDHYLRNVDNPLVVPVNEKVRLLITAADVIHSWWVPQLGVKRDAIPGYINQSWFKATKIGTYRGNCAELCGVDHGFMPIVVKVVSHDDFRKWIAEHAEPAVTNADETVSDGTVAQL